MHGVRLIPPIRPPAKWLSGDSESASLGDFGGCTAGAALGSPFEPLGNVGPLGGNQRRRRQHSFSGGRRELVAQSLSAADLHGFHQHRADGFVFQVPTRVPLRIKRAHVRATRGEARASFWGVHRHLIAHGSRLIAGAGALVVCLSVRTEHAPPTSQDCHLRFARGLADCGPEGAAEVLCLTLYCSKAVVTSTSSVVSIH